MPALGLAGWAGGLAAAWLPLAATAAAPVVALAVAWRRGSRAALAGALVFAAVAAGAVLRQAQVEADPVSALAAEGAAVEAELVVTSDPRPTRSGFGDGVVLRGTVVRVTGRGVTYELRSPVLVLADESWSGVPLGARVSPHRTAPRARPRRRPLVGGGLRVRRAAGRHRPGPVVAGAPARSGPRCATRSPTVRRSSARSCRRWWWATTPGSTRSWPRSSGRPGSRTCSRSPGPTSRSSSASCCWPDGGAGSAAAVTTSSAGWASSGSCCWPAPSPASCARPRWAPWRCSGWAWTAGAADRARSASRWWRCCCSIRASRCRSASRCRWSPRPGSSCSGPGCGTRWDGGCRAGRRRRSRSRWQPSWRARRWWPRSPARSAWWRSAPTWPSRPSSAPPPCWDWPAASWGWSGTPGGRLLGTLAGWCVAWLVAVADRGAALPAAAIGWGTGVWALAALTVLVVVLALVLPRLLRGPVGSLALLRRARRGGAGAAAGARLAAAGVGAGRLRRRPGRRAGAARRARGGRGRRRRPGAAAGRRLSRPAAHQPGAAAGAHPPPRRPRRRPGRGPQRPRGRRDRDDRHRAVRRDPGRRRRDAPGAVAAPGADGLQPQRRQRGAARRGGRRPAAPHRRRGARRARPRSTAPGRG